MLYIALFRGLNVGGKNLVSMKELQETFIKLRYSSVETIGNTGIVIFLSDNDVSGMSLAKELSASLNVEIKSKVLSFTEFDRLMKNLPDWWNQNKDWRHNGIFFLDDYPLEKFSTLVETLDPVIEKAQIIGKTLVWSSAFKERKLYYKSNYAKLLKHEAYPQMTIRNGNTLNKVYAKACSNLESEWHNIRR